jgi:hypothetical protein
LTRYQPSGASSKTKSKGKEGGLTRSSHNRTAALLLYGAVAVVDLVLIAASSDAVAWLRQNGLLSSNQLAEFFVSQLDLRAEGVIAAWYSSMLLFSAGLVAALLWNSRAHGGWGWVLIALLLIALSADEVAQIHEQLPGRYAWHTWREGAAPPTLAGPADWAPFLLPAIVVAAAGMTVFFIFALRSHRLSLVTSLAAVICWIGVIAAESKEGSAQSTASLGHTRFLEESLEIIGATLLLISFVELLRSRSGSGSGKSRRRGSP